MKKLWLIFAQSATIALGVMLALSVLQPDWLKGVSNKVVVVKESTEPPAGKATLSYQTAVRKATPAVVNIFTEKTVRKPQNPFMNDPLFRQFFGDRFPDQVEKNASLGSGVVVSSKGYILTNHHVVDGADEIQVAFANGKTLPATIVGSDPDTDLAVLKVDADNLPSITFGDSDKAQVGDVVLAIGDPFGVGQTVTMGIISALGRSQLGINTFEDFIQTDAAINPGNSGGALIDTSGNLIGINSAIYSKSGGSLGIGFAIPGKLAQQIMEQIIQHGSVTRGWLGVELQDITPELAESFQLPTEQGAIISGVLNNGPADRAGIKPGDILTGINGKDIADAKNLLYQIAALKPGEKADLSLLRDNRKMRLNVTIGKRPVDNK